MRESAPHIPLSPAQERLWILDQLSPEGSYNVTLCFELTGVMHEDALRRAVISVVERHEALRTCIDETEDGLVGQSGTPQAAVERVVCDGDDTAVAALLEQAALRPFDLSAGPLLRVRVIDLPGELYIVLVVLHHGAFDGLSGAILSRELWQSYDAHAAGRSPALPGPVAAPYSSFAAAQRAWLGGPEAAEQLAYWTRQLSDAPGPVDLTAMGEPRPTAGTEEPAIHTFELPEQAAREVSAACELHGVTSFMVLLAAFAGALLHHTGTDDLVIGTPVTDRPSPEFESVIGPFDNTVLIRLGTRDEPTADAFLESVCDTTVDALVNKDVPFHHVMRALAPARRGITTPVPCNVAFSVETRPQDPGPVHDAVVAIRDWAFAPPARFDLTLMVDTSDASMTGRLYYDPERVHPSIPPALADGVRALITAFAYRPKAPLFPSGEEPGDDH
ncbi:condensation domain-containing protein [Streptomyces populi]